MTRALRIVAVGIVGLVVTGMTAWAALAVRHSDLPQARLLGGLFALATVLAFAVLPRRRALAGFAVAFAVVLGWWLRIAPSNDRDWQPEVAVLPSATIAGERVTLHNIRNFDYRTETDFTPRWYDASFDLADLQSGDIVACYWMGDAIAHILVSFGFTGDRHVAVSIETRKERGEEYSTIAGFFKQYELYYVVGDERDLIRVRTNFRQPPDDVYVYRTRVPRENLRRLFLDYVRRINELKEHPAFYNTLTTNCTTNVLLHTRVNPDSPPLSWKVLLSGYAPQYAYELGRLDTSLPFAELRRRSRVNDRAQAADPAADFSRRIREGLPGMDGRPGGANSSRTSTPPSASGGRAARRPAGRPLLTTAAVPPERSAVRHVGPRSAPPWAPSPAARRPRAPEREPSWGVSPGGRVPSGASSRRGHRGRTIGLAPSPRAWRPAVTACDESVKR